MIPPRQNRVVPVLGIVQIFTWGSTFYLLAILSVPIAADTGWAMGTITAGVSIALLVSGLVARRVGRTIRALGGRPVLIVGVTLIVIGLAVLGSARSVPVYVAAWIIIGAGMGGSLYEAAFSTLAGLFGRDARPAITALTLWGGFASTVCWPISAILVETIGWRFTCFAYALLHLGLTLPLCWWALPRMPTASPRPDDPGATVEPGPIRLDIRFWCIAIAGMCLSMLFSILSIHLITILQAAGYGVAVAVGLGALIGPAQVGARLLEFVSGGRHHPVFTMIAAAFLVFSGLLMLALDVAVAVALVAYGAGTGLWSIARGTLPLAVFEPQDYPVVVGYLATPMLVASAAAPLIASGLIDAYGPGHTIRLLAILATTPCIAALILYRRIDGPTLRG